jgi:hypothetical protein
MKHIRFVFLIALTALISSASSYAQAIPSQNHQISLADAKRYIQNYRNNPTPDPAYRGGYFWRQIVDTILAQPDCVGIRYYYAKADNGTPTIVVVGVDASGTDMEGGVIGEFTLPCPPYCDTNSSLSK